MHNRTVQRCALLLALAVPAGACSDSGPDEAEASVGNETLAAALADGDDTGAMSEALQETGLAQIFDGSAAYTVLAPSDASIDAIAGLGDMPEVDRNAVLAAILREHVLPGALTPEDIENAIEVQDGQVSIQTMGDGMMRFAMQGDRLTVTDDNGRTATVSGAPVLASNGVVIPIDVVLKQP